MSTVSPVTLRSSNGVCVWNEFMHYVGIPTSVHSVLLQCKRTHPQTI